MEKFYDRLDKRTKRREGEAEQKREVYRERIKNITEALYEAEGKKKLIEQKVDFLDEYEFQETWDQIYPDKIPYNMKASSSEWMIKKDFRKRAEQSKLLQRFQNKEKYFKSEKERARGKLRAVFFDE